jgi:rRNA methylases
MMMTITSKSNKIVKLVNSLKLKKYRTTYQKFLVEGASSVHDALVSQADIDFVCVSESYSFDMECKVPIYQVKDEIFEGMSCTKSPQGILACVTMRKQEILPKSDRFYLFCDEVNDPGNAGTIIRTADACGCDAVLFSKNSVDIYSDKTIRASMGSFFHVPVLDNVEKDWLSDMKNKGYRVAGGILDEDSESYTQADFTAPIILVVGNEANGVSDTVKQICTQKVVIPIFGKAESLNVAVAAALLCYEVKRRQG